VLLVFAGASWRPSASAWWWIPVLLFLVARVAGKIGSARLGARINGALPVLGNDWGRALIGQGGLALALALDYTRFEGAVLPNIVFSAAIASVLLTDVTSARLIHSVMSRLLPHGPIRRRITSGAGERSGATDPSANGAAPGSDAADTSPAEQRARVEPSTPSSAERR
jgi:Kef-type K+ transport system membrane component KefB